MSYNYDYDMKYTDNPYIDLLVHNTKIMAINSVVKNETEALNYETLESRSESDKMISYKQGHPIDPNYNPDDYVELNNYLKKRKVSRGIVFFDDEKNPEDLMITFFSSISIVAVRPLYCFVIFASPLRCSTVLIVIHTVL